MENQIQNIVENKKSKMYVSWWIILIDFFTVNAITWGPYFAMNMFHVNYNRSDSLMILFAIGWLFVFVVALLLMSSVFKKPRWYVRKDFVNSTFVGTTFILSLFWLYFDFSLLFIPLVLISLFIGTSVSIFINHIYEKSETELEITKS